METTVGREPVAYVQIDQDFCSREYGEAPCQAALGETGVRKCFNTLVTCQDTPNFDRSTLPLTFTTARENPGVDGLYVLPFLEGISTTPTRIATGGANSDATSLGNRASVSISFSDYPHSDVLVDPYLSERDYIATDRGTFWSKWLARNPYYVNRRVRIYEGYRGQSLSEMQRREYLIDRIDGPDANGGVKVVAKDVLKLADNDKAQVPAATQGELANNVNETETGQVRLLGAVAADYPAPGIALIGNEIITYSSSADDGDAEVLLNVTARGQRGTQADSHEEGERVQRSLEWDQVRVDELVYDWLVNYANVPAEFIDFAEWQEEANVWLDQFRLSGVVAEPTGVTDLISEVSEQCLFTIWWDERRQTIPLRATKPPLGDVKVFDEDKNILAGSVQLQSRPKERVSQVWVFYDQRNPTERLDSESNYRKVRIRADLASETAEQYDEQRIKKVFSRWLRSEAQAINTSSRLLSRYRDNPRYLTIEVDAKDRDTWTGDVIDTISRQVVDFTGQPETVRWQIISAEETVPGHKTQYELVVYEYGTDTRAGRWMAADAPVYTEASETELTTGMFWSDADGNMSDGEPGYTWT